MTIFVVNIGNEGYGQYTIPIIKKLCDYNNVNLFVLDKNINQNIYNLHPSWLKLFCFDFVDDDFIITWDLDLVPLKLYDFKKFFELDKFNLANDSSYLIENFNFNGKFKYNCGLMGIPKKYDSLLKSIYLEKGKNSYYPSMEQYHVNDTIFDEKLPVNLLDHKLNTLFNGDENINENIYNMHYTWKIGSLEHKIELIKKHLHKYGNNF